MKTYNILSDGRAARIISVSHITPSCVYLLPPGGWVGWREFSLPVRVSSRATNGAYRSLLDETGSLQQEPVISEECIKKQCLRWE